MLEVWKPVHLPEYCKYYEVSNLGEVRSLDRTIVTSKGITRKLRGRVLKPAYNGSGYLFVGLQVDNQLKQLSVHRLVAEVFVSNPDRYSEVNHENGIKDDNRSVNLKWCSKSYNIQHALNSGLKPRGENINTNILTVSQVLKVCELLDAKGMTQVSIGKMFGIHKDTVSAINTGKNWNWLTNRKGRL